MRKLSYLCFLLAACGNIANAKPDYCSFSVPGGIKNEFVLVIRDEDNIKECVIFHFGAPVKFINPQLFAAAKEQLAKIGKEKFKIGMLNEEEDFEEITDALVADRVKKAKAYLNNDKKTDNTQPNGAISSQNNTQPSADPIIDRNNVNSTVETNDNSQPVAIVQVRTSVGLESSPVRVPGPSPDQRSVDLEQSSVAQNQENTLASELQGSELSPAEEQQASVVPQDPESSAPTESVNRKKNNKKFKQTQQTQPTQPTITPLALVEEA